MGNQNQARMVQKYIEKPLIFENFRVPIISDKKFDIRQWVLVKSFEPLVIYRFSKFYLRLCSENFDLRDFRNQSKHLTNYSVNKTNFISQQQQEESVVDTENFLLYLFQSREAEYRKQVQPLVDKIII